MEELSVESVKLLDLANVDLVQMSNISDLSCFKFKKQQVIQGFITRRQSVRDEVERVELGFKEMQTWASAA